MFQVRERLRSEIPSSRLRPICSEITTLPRSASRKKTKIKTQAKRIFRSSDWYIVSTGWVRSPTKLFKAVHSISSALSTNLGNIDNLGGILGIETVIEKGIEKRVNLTPVLCNAPKLQR